MLNGPIVGAPLKEWDRMRHQRPETQQRYETLLGEIEKLDAADIAQAIEYIDTRPRRVAVAEMPARPNEQA